VNPRSRSSNTSRADHDRFEPRRRTRLGSVDLGKSPYPYSRKAPALTGLYIFFTSAMGARP